MKMNIIGPLTKISVFIAIALILIILGYAIFGNRVLTKSSPLIGKEAPDFSLELFNGGTTRLSDSKGKSVLLNFWASWCIPCRDEAPALEASWKKYKDKNAVFIGVNIWDDERNARNYLTKYPAGYMNGVDKESEILLNYGVSGVPETYFIDKNGKITNKYTGPLTEEIIEYFIQRALSPSENDKISMKDN